MDGFQGHQFVKIVNDNWVLDLTEYVGYYVELNRKKEVKGHHKVFEVVNENGEWCIDDVNTSYDKKIPIRVKKEVIALVNKIEAEGKLGIDPTV